MNERTKLALKFEAVLISICLALAALWFLCSCTTTKVVTVEKVKTDTTYITKQQRDSIWLHDSIFVSQQQRGDTILLTTTKWHTKYIEREVHDTLYQSKCDSIPIPYEVIKEVPRQKTLMENIVFCAGIIAFMCVILFIANKLKRFLP
jgi:hypothetical protein